MGFFSRLIASEEETAFPTAKPRRLAADWVAHGVAYDPGLVDKLKLEHQELARLYAAIQAAAAEERFQQISRLLFGLKLVLQKHIMLENVNFYVYLEQNCEPDSDIPPLVSELRREMDGIARLVVKFVNAHTLHVPTSGTVDRFTAELEQIGNVLFSRMQMEEEHLYAIYQPNY